MMTKGEAIGRLTGRTPHADWMDEEITIKRWEAYEIAVKYEIRNQDKLFQEWWDDPDFEGTGEKRQLDDDSIVRIYDTVLDWNCNFPPPDELYDEVYKIRKENGLWVETS